MKPIRRTSHYEISNTPIKFARQMYRSQKKSASGRNIPFLLSFAEWLVIWEMSGKLDERGRGSGKYVMGRKGDLGPYKLGNVDIITGRENISQAHKGKKHPPELVKRRNAAISHPRKLTEEQILDIEKNFQPRKQYSKFGANAFAKKYGVDPATIRNVAYRRVAAYKNRERMI